MNLKARKYQLIEGIMQVTDEQIISRFESLLRDYQSDFNALSHLVKPIKEQTDVDALIKEQSYQGVDQEKFNKLVEEIGIEEPLDDLLKMI